jgi:hypothetical protein
MKITRPKPPGHEGLREQQCRLHVHRLHLAPRGERELLEGPERDHGRRMDQDVAPAVAVEYMSRCPAYSIRIAQVNRDVAVAVQGDHGVVRCQTGGNRAADCARPARHDGNPPVRTGLHGHRQPPSLPRCLRSVGGSRTTPSPDARHTASACPRLLAPVSDSQAVSTGLLDDDGGVLIVLHRRWHGLS